MTFQEQDSFRALLGGVTAIVLAGILIWLKLVKRASPSLGKILGLVMLGIFLIWISYL